MSMSERGTEPSTGPLERNRGKEEQMSRSKRLIALASGVTLFLGRPSDGSGHTSALGRSYPGAPASTGFRPESGCEESEIVAKGSQAAMGPSGGASARPCGKYRLRTLAGGGQMMTTKNRKVSAQPGTFARCVAATMRRLRFLAHLASRNRQLTKSWRAANPTTVTLDGLHGRPKVQGG